MDQYVSFESLTDAELILDEAVSIKKSEVYYVYMSEFENIH